MVNTEKLDINKVRIFLKLHNLNQEKEKSLMNYLLETEEVVQVNKTVGDWDMEIDMETLNKSSIRQLIMQLREKFKEEK